MNVARFFFSYNNLNINNFLAKIQIFANLRMYMYMFNKKMKPKDIYIFEI